MLYKSLILAFALLNIVLAFGLRNQIFLAMGQEECPIKYIVKPGDTLYLLAPRYNSSINEIVAFNNITDPNSIYVGQLLHIPCKNETLVTSIGPTHEANMTTDMTPIHEANMTSDMTPTHETNMTADMTLIHETNITTDFTPTENVTMQPIPEFENRTA